MDTETDPARGRARGWTATGLVVTGLPLLPFVAYGLVRAGVLPAGVPLVLGLVCPAAVYILFPELVRERAPFRHTSSHLTARTLLGERSVDLNGSPPSGC